MYPACGHAARTVARRVVSKLSSSLPASIRSSTNVNSSKSLTPNYAIGNSRHITTSGSSAAKSVNTRLRTAMPSTSRSLAPLASPYGYSVTYIPSISSSQHARMMSVNLGPKHDPVYTSTRFPYYFGKFFGRHGGILGLGRLTPFILGAVAAACYWVWEQPGLDAIVEKPEMQTVESQLLWNDNTVRLFAMMPTRLGSRIWGYLTHMTLPVALREPIYGFYSRLFNVIMEEVPRPLAEFESLNAFFTRRVSPSFRPIASTEVVSPVDGKVLVYGDCDGLWSEQVKGINYSLQSLLGSDAIQMISSMSKDRRKNNAGHLPPLKYCVIYLAPGDYHGIHSPVEWTIKDVRHFTGHLFSVSPGTSARLHGLLAVNERVCLNGTYPHGFFSMTPVGAYNVGSITLEWDPVFNTNLAEHKSGEYYQLEYEKDIKATKGEPVSFFNLGSTVVMIFEAPEDFEWKVDQGGYPVKLGQPLCGSK